MGTKELSEGLYNCKYYNQLSLYFDYEEGRRIGVFVPGWDLRRLKGNSRELLPFINILTVSFSAFRDTWKIRLYPVKPDNSKRIKSFLKENGLATVKKWLNKEKPETWFEGYRNFQIGINQGVSKYCIFETHNEYVVYKKIASIN